MHFKPLARLNHFLSAVLSFSLIVLFLFYNPIYQITGGGGLRGIIFSFLPIIFLLLLGSVNLRLGLNKDKTNGWLIVSSVLFNLNVIITMALTRLIFVVAKDNPYVGWGAAFLWIISFVASLGYFCLALIGVAVREFQPGRSAVKAIVAFSVFVVAVFVFAGLASIEYPVFVHATLLAAVAAFALAAALVAKRFGLLKIK